MDALMAELEYYGSEDYIFDTIYIGGGSPSFINTELIQSIFEGIHRSLTVSKNSEVTIEVNPGQLTREKLQAYMGLGINRLSIGMQSFNDSLLKLMGRIHKVKDSIDCYRLARENGFTNISLDLIFALPGQTLKDWIYSLNKALSLNPEHISFYALQIEEGTPFYNQINKGSIEAASDYLDRKMYHKAIEMLSERGYHHYEISNGAMPGCESCHNMKYWSMTDYLGVGLGSHSYIQGTRFSNEDNLWRYIELSKEHRGKNFGAGQSPWVTFSHKNTKRDEMAEYMFTGLRKVEGINIGDFIDRFGISPLQYYRGPIEKWFKEGLLVPDGEKGMVYLTLKGLDLFNSVLIDFI